MLRIGQGIDVHAFCEGRPLILAGVEIPYEHGLAGHSDADVVIHALVDALLGTVGEGDIGQHFPDNNPQYQNANSQIFLEKACEILNQYAYRINNMDITIMAQQPKLMPFIAKMKSRLAEICGLDESQISIKATTTEQLGFVGRKEGITAMATVLVSPKNKEA